MLMLLKQTCKLSEEAGNQIRYKSIKFHFFSFEEIIQHKVDFESALKENMGFPHSILKNNSHLKSFRIF